VIKNVGNNIIICTLHAIINKIYLKLCNICTSIIYV